MNVTHHHYRVGGHLFSLALPPELVPAAALAPYAPFRTEEGAAPLFSLTLTDDDDNDSLPAAASPLIRLDDENGSMELFTTPGGGLLIHFARPGCPVCCRLSMDSRYRHARAVLRGDARERRYALDNTLMLLYAFASAPHATLLLHASVIENDGRGYLFLGRSGTGKSTHSRLWTEHIPGTQLLNDDNPVLRLTPDGLPIVYGSPWSGKTPCYRNLGILAVFPFATRRHSGSGTLQLSLRHVASDFATCCVSLSNTLQLRFQHVAFTFGTCCIYFSNTSHLLLQRVAFISPTCCIYFSGVLPVLSSCCAFPLSF